MAVVDTIGAGDYFTSGTLLALLAGASLQAAAECGCAAGTAAVQAAGAELGPHALAALQAAIDVTLAADAARHAGGGSSVAAAAAAAAAAEPPAAAAKQLVQA